MALSILNDNNLDSFSIYTGILIILMSRIVPSVSKLPYVQNIKFNEVFDNVYERFKDNQPSIIKKVNPDKFDSIEFKNISFKYQGLK